MSSSARTDGARETWSLVPIVGSVLSAFLASVCCVGPLVFALLGLGGAGLLLKFEPYRPYFTVATFAMLGAGFYFTYRRPASARVDGGPDCACPAPRANRVGKIALWIAAILVVGFLGFPPLAPYLFS